MLVTWRASSRAAIASGGRRSSTCSRTRTTSSRSPCWSARAAEGSTRADLLRRPRTAPAGSSWLAPPWNLWRVRQLLRGCRSGDRAGAACELVDQVRQLLRALQLRRVAAVGEDLELQVGVGLGRPPAVRDRKHPVGGAPDHEHRQAQLPQAGEQLVSRSLAPERGDLPERPAVAADRLGFRERVARLAEQGTG